ncbi:MAG TPA: pitrilysin family protein, partial [Bacteroidales bacterium]|nr:pitrilysin family protein [Bacteroidales bacterium]
QLDRSKPPKPGVAPEIKIGQYKSFVLANGLKVFVVENHKIPLVTYSITFINPPAMQGNFAGCSSITGDLLGTATLGRTKEQINEEVDFIGASFSSSAEGIVFSSLKKHTDKLLDIVSDILLHPVFKEEELEKIRTQTLSAIAVNKADPNVVATDVINVLNFGGNHPYGELVTETTVKNITLDKCKEFFTTFYRPNVAYMSIVGDITLEEARPLVEKYFGAWEKQAVPLFTYKKPFPPSERRVAVVNRDQSVQSVVNVGYAVDLALSDPDYIKARVANTVLGGGTYRLFNNLREQHGYTYGAYSSLRTMPLGSSFVASASVANAVTDSSVYQILYEMQRIRREPVPADELSRVKNYMSGNFALSLEDPQTIAGFAINTERYKLPKDFYKNYLKNLAAVTASDVLAASKKYILPDNSNILVVGKASDVADKLKSFGRDLKYYTDEGVAYNPATGIPLLPDSLKAADVYNKLVEVTGGANRLSGVKDMSLRGTIHTQDMDIAFTRFQKFPDKVFTEIKMGNSLLSRTVMFGNKAVTTGVQGDVDVVGAEFDLLKLQALIFPETRLEEYGFVPLLKGLVKMDEKLNYMIEIATPSGNVISDYIDKETGLRTKTVAEVEGTNGKTSLVLEYLGYFDMDGVKFVKKMKQTTGNKSFVLDIESIDINTNLSDEVFK